MIFVTGGTGLVGAHILLDLASKNKSIKALKRESSSMAITKKVFSHYNKQDLLQNIKWVDGDLLDSQSLYSLLKGYKYVYHAAAFVSFLPKETKKMMDINIIGTQNIVNACLDNKIEKLDEVVVTAEVETITAWYTPQIPVSHGPAEYGGLPGLILELTNDRTVMLCTKVVMNPEKRIEISEPTKGEFVTKGEFENIVEVKVKEMRDMWRGQRGKSSRRN